MNEISTNNSNTEITNILPNTTDVGLEVLRGIFEDTCSVDMRTFYISENASSDALYLRRFEPRLECSEPSETKRIHFFQDAKLMIYKTEIFVLKQNSVAWPGISPPGQACQSHSSPFRHAF